MSGVVRELLAPFPSPMYMAKLYERRDAVLARLEMRQRELEMTEREAMAVQAEIRHHQDAAAAVRASVPTTRGPYR